MFCEACRECQARSNFHQRMYSWNDKRRVMGEEAQSRADAIASVWIVDASQVLAREAAVSPYVTMQLEPWLFEPLLSNEKDDRAAAHDEMG